MDIQIIITQEDVDRYNDEYFKLHPKSTKKRINGPQHPTLNWYMTANNMAANSVKQEWKNFIIDILRREGLVNMRIDVCEIIYRTYFKDKRKRDIDNITPKFIFDGFVEGKFIQGDDYSHIKKLTTECGYDKDNPRIEIIIKVL